VIECKKTFLPGVVMNRFIPFIICLIWKTALPTSAETFQLILEPRWDDLEQNAQKEQQFGSKLILIGKIIFKKKTKEDMKLSKIFLQWHGDSIDTLSGSLYKKEPDKEFMPIEEHVICDSTWNKEQQSLILNFNHAQKLGIHSEFYLVLSVPQSLEKVLKAGHFSIEEKCLPEALQDSAKNDELIIALGEAHPKKRIISVH
jgi:hypothetical protein